MEEQQGPQQELPPPTLGTWLVLISRIGWGALILFGMVGVLAGKEMGAYVIMITATVWVSLRILAEAFLCFRMLQYLFSSPEDEDDSNEEPPGGGEEE